MAIAACGQGEEAAELKDGSALHTLHGWSIHGDPQATAPWALSSQHHPRFVDAKDPQLGP